MKRILITGGRGFLGRNLASHLEQRTDCEVFIFDQDNSQRVLRNWLMEADIVFHLAGVNRSNDVRDFDLVNRGLTLQICSILLELGRAPKIVFSSSIQADLDNPYGASKAAAEEALRLFAAKTGASLKIYRLKNLFGKWCRPNYNSVTATICHNIARDLPIKISDPLHEIDLTCVDDVVEELLAEVDGDGTGVEIPSYIIELGELAGRIQAFHEVRHTLTLPDFADRLNRSLYATYLSHVPMDARMRKLKSAHDERGSLAEFIKQDHFGQIFVSRTRPGVTRGNHYHHTKTEKFLVAEGSGLIRMRAIGCESIEEYTVAGDTFQVVDIPPGFTHSIKNVGDREMVTLFWASEIFNPDCPDTFFLPVDIAERTNIPSRETL